MKKIVSVILAACMLFALVPVTTATETALKLADDGSNVVTEQEISDFISYSVKPYSMFWCGIYKSGIGKTMLSYAPDNEEKIDSVVEEVTDLIVRFRNGEKVTREDLSHSYDRIDEVARTIVIDRIWLTDLVELCSYEQNLNNYYPEELWSVFQTKLQEATAISKNEAITDIRVSDAYWELLFCFHDLCIFNLIPGDLDASGDTDIIDVTWLQRYLVNMISLNSSQKSICVINRQTGDEPDVTDATMIQRYLVGMVDTIDAPYIYDLLKYGSHRVCVTNYYYEYYVRRNHSL